MEALLERIAQNTEPKSSMQIVVTDNKTQFKTRFNPPIQLDKSKRYEIALVNLETYYSFPNIKSNNNYFRYSPDNGANWYDIYVPEGSYDITDINDVIQLKMKQNGHYDTINDRGYITISVNTNTMKSVLTLENNYQVDFRKTKSISSLLGFNNFVYTQHDKSRSLNANAISEVDHGIHESENVVNVMSINSLLVNIDIISGSYVNGTSQPTIYSFFPNVSPGYKIVETPRNLVYLPITLDVIHGLETSLTDQNGTAIDNRGETLTIRFHLREV